MMRFKDSIAGLGMLLTLTACQNSGNSGDLDRPGDLRSTPTRRTTDMDISKVPIVTTEKAVKIGLFWRSHSNDLESRKQITYAYWVVYSKSWTQQNGGIQLKDPFAPLGYPIYRPMEDETLTDEAMNRFLNFMISQKLNEFPTRASVDPALFKDPAKNVVALYVETPQFKKIIFRDDLIRDEKLIVGFKTIQRYLAMLCNEAHVTYVGASVDDQHDWQKQVPPK